MSKGIGLITKKIGMTQIFDSNGTVIPITALQASHSRIIKIEEKSNFNNISISGWPLKNEKNTKKSSIQFFKQLNFPVFKYIKEYKIDKDKNFKVGDEINLSFFIIGEKIRISGLSIGKGTLGNIKRHGFKRGPMTHGSKHHRLQGSLGAGTTPSRVFPGKKMSGRTGNKMTTFFGIEIIDIDTEKNILLVKGSIPGKFGNIIYIQKYT
jgi:large subunit ribosomal protein L3